MSAPVTAQGLLKKAADLMDERGRQYDKPEGERSMAATVAALNATTGRDDWRAWLGRAGGGIVSPAQQVAAWNASVEVGAKAYLGPTGMPRFTRAAAQVLHDGRAVVWLDTFMGAVSLDSVRPA